MKNALFLAAFALLIMGCAGSSSNSIIAPGSNISGDSTSRMPSVTVADLAGRELLLPQDLARPSLLVIGFAHDQRSAMNDWMTALKGAVKEYPNVGVFKIAVIDSSNAALRAIIRAGMRSAATGDAQRETLTLFTDKDHFGHMLGLELTQPTAMLVEPDGRISWRASGMPQNQALSELKENILMKIQ